jgi:hypothetical protein
MPVIHHDFTARRAPAAPEPISHSWPPLLPSAPRDAAFHLAHFSDDYHFDTIISTFPGVAEEIFARLGVTRDEFIDAAIAHYLPTTPAKD